MDPPVYDDPPVPPQGQFDEAPNGGSMPSNAPMPRRGPPQQGHWAERSSEGFQVQQGTHPIYGHNPLVQLCYDAELDTEEMEASLEWMIRRCNFRTIEDLMAMHPNDVDPEPDIIRDSVLRLQDLAFAQQNQAAEEENISIADSKPSHAPEFYEEEPVTLSRVEEVLAIEHGLRASCRTLPITIASWIFFTLLIFYHGEVQGSFDSANTIRRAMETIEVPAVNHTDTLRELRIGTISERYDIIQWVKEGLVPTLTVPGLRHGQLRRTQQMLGKVRFSQIRGVPEDCDIPDAIKSSFYDGMCHPSGGAPSVYGDPPVVLLEYQFPFEPYTIGDNQRLFVAWLDVGRNISTVNKQLDSLLDSKWLDDDTHEVAIEAMFLNAELNVYSKLKINFELHRGGWIQQSIHVTPFRGDVHYHWAVIWLDVMWVTVMLFLVWQATLHFIEEYQKGLFKWWITDFFTWIDILSITGGVGIAMFFFGQSVEVDNFVKECELGNMPIESGIDAAMSWKTRYILWNWQYEQDVQNIFDSFDRVEGFIQTNRFLALCYNLIIVLRFYRGFTGQPRIAVILQTIYQVSMFLFHYMIVLIIVMANFILTGYILFGEQLRDWATIGNATCSAWLMLFGRFNYDQLHEVAPISAAVWFASFFCLVILVISGLTTATILHHYLAVRSRTGQPGESIVKQLNGMLEDFCYGRSYDGSQKSLPPDKLFDMITANSDPEHIKQLAHFKIDRRMRSRHDVHEAEIDPKVDEEFLMGRGMDELQAIRFLERIQEAGHHIEMRSAAVPRLTLFIARQMSQLRFRAEHMKDKTTAKVKWSSKAVDRVDLKHAKTLALAERIRKAQQLPPGWTQHVDEEGKRYLRQEETGLTSWTLPRHLI